MMALKVGQRRHRGLLRRNRNQYSEVDANPIEVWSTGKKYKQTYEANK